MNSRSVRNSFLLGMTLSELGFIMFFLMVLLSASLINKKDDELINLNKKLDDQMEENDEQSKKIELLNSIKRTIEKYFPKLSKDELNEKFKKLVDSEVKTLEIEKLKKSQSTLQEEIDVLSSEKEKLDSMIDALNKDGVNVDPVQEIKELLEKKNKLEKMINTLNKQGLDGDPIDELINIVDKINDIERQKKNVEGQYENLRARLEKDGNGLDHPPCWANSETGAIEYLYRVTIHENSLQIEPAWPEYRKDELGRIPSALKLSNKLISISKFQSMAQPILSWSKKQTPECRHFVKLKDSDETTKNAFRNNMLTVENYFYKYLVKN